MKPLTTSNPPVVLLVDDEPSYRSALARLLLNKYDLTIIHADNAIQAFNLLEKQEVAVVVTDELMPGPSGMTLLTSVRDCWPNIRRVLLTSFSTATHVLSGVADEVLDKGLDSWLIVDTIGHLANQERDVSLQ